MANQYSGLFTISQQMQAQAASNWPVIPPSDPLFEYVTLLLDGNGANGGQNNTFLDSSSNNFTITRNGNTTQGSFSPYGSFWSNYFNGSNDYLTVADNAALQFGTGAFTMEAWVNLNRTTGYQVVLSKYTNSTTGYEIGITSGVVSANFSGDGADITGTTTLLAGVWYHIAVSGTPGATGIKLFINGVQEGSTYTGSTSLSPTATLNIGRFSLNSDYLQGYISNLRIVKGAAVYTSNFTPSEAPLTAITNTSLLTCQSNRFVDNSTNAFTVTPNSTPSVQRFSPFEPEVSYSTATIGGSGYFDGSGDYLTGPQNAAFQFGTGDFTVEGWTYSTSTTKNFFFDTRDPNNVTGDGGGFVLFGGNNSALSAFISGSGYSFSDLTPRAFCWNHVAFVRSSGTFYGYLNGVRSATSHSLSVNMGANFSTIGTNANNRVGSNVSDWWPQGYMTDLRVAKSAVYTGSTYTVPTAPLGSVSNISILCKYQNASIFDYVMQNDLETIGNAQISTSVKKYGTGSISFDGTDDRLVMAPNTALNFGAGNFTIEMWVYRNNSNNASLYHRSAPSTDTPGNVAILIQSNRVTVFVDSNNAFPADLTLNGATSISTTTWTHIAVVRNGTSVKLYVNGTEDASGTFSGSTAVTSDPLLIGYWRDGDPISFNGYIDDLRVTNGVARYTANFTPPTAELPTY